MEVQKKADQGLQAIVLPVQGTLWTACQGTTSNHSNHSNQVF